MAEKTPQFNSGSSQPAKPPSLPPVPPNAKTVAEADPKNGEQHFNQHCSACHQIGGVGLPGLAPSIRNRDFLAIADDDFIRKTIALGRAGTPMVPRPDLKHNHVTEIIAYLRSIKVPNPPKLPADLSRESKGDIARGANHFQIYCASCHGPGGQGYSAGGAGPGIGLPSFLAAASDGYIYHTVKQGRAGTAMRSFNGADGLANLSDQDIDDIIVWLRRPQ